MKVYKHLHRCVTCNPTETPAPECGHWQDGDHSYQFLEMTQAEWDAVVAAGDKARDLVDKWAKNGTCDVTVIDMRLQPLELQPMPFIKG